MSVNEQTKRVLSFLLSVILLLQYVPAPALAEEIPQAGLCEHHVAHEDCGYVAAVAGVDCNHEHDDNCNTVECTHNHDENCGYVEAVEGRECDFVCEACAAEEADAAAVAEVKALMDALPTLDDIQRKPMEQQQEDYLSVQEAYDVYEKLTDDQKALLSDSEAVFAPYFAYFNTLIMEVDVPDMASGTCGEDLTWKLGQDGILTICGSGEMEDYVFNLEKNAYDTPWYDYREFIRCVRFERNDKGSIRSIGVGAFYGCNVLIEIFIPESVKHIGEYAFGHCKGLIEIVIPENVGDIRAGTFYHCDSLTTVSLHQWLVEIGDNAFYHCDSLREISIPENVTCIGRESFAQCDSLTEIVIPGEVKSIGVATFAYCDNLTNISISEGISSIEILAFDCCKNLESISFPASVNYIASQAFSGCEKLGEIRFSGNACSIDEDAFQYVTASAYYPANDTSWTEDVMQSYGGTITWVPYGAEEEKAIVASGTCGKNLTWTLDADGLLTISGSGAMTDFAVSGSPWNGIRSKIQSVKMENGATRIGDYAFYYCNNLSSMIIPDSVTSIGRGAFMYTGQLNITIPDSVTSIGVSTFQSSSVNSVTLSKNLTSIPEDMFHWSALKSIHIPEGITEIGTSAFSVCKSLTSVTMEDSVTNIHDYAFSDCTKLTDIDLSDNIKTMGIAVFAGCSALTHIKIPDGVTAIAERTFNYCSNLTEITIPDSVVSIGDSAFSPGCRALTAITIPKNVSSIGYGAFWDCSALETVTFTGNAPQIDRTAFANMTATAYYPAGNDSWTEDVMQNYSGRITWICESCRYGHTEVVDEAVAATCSTDGLSEGKHCSVCSKVIVQQEVTPATREHNFVDSICGTCGIIGGSCGDNLTWSVDENTGTLTISGSGDMYHYGPDGGPWGDEIVTVVVEEGVTSIGDYAFFFTPSLQTVIMADSVLSIGEMAFANCRSLSSADLPGNLTAIGWQAFWDTNICDVHIPATVTQIGEGAFAGNHASKNITVAAGNTSYLAEDGILFTANKDALLYYPPAKTNSQYIVPDSVERIGERAFSGNESLTSVVLPEGITEIGYLGFEYCSNLASVTLPSTLTDIGSCAFIFTGLQEITIPENVAKIGAIAFYGCTLLRELTFQGDAPSFEQSASIVEDMFTNVEATAYYPANNPTWTSDVMQDYGGSITWIGYDGSVFSGVCGDDLIWNFDEETGALTISGSGAMYHYRYEEIPWGPFREKILSVSLSEGVTNIGEFAFRNCANLNQIALPQTVTEIAYRAFSDCSSLKEVEVPNSVTTISYNAFTNCTDLMEITIPENVTAIESEVFRNCSSLKTVALPSSVTEIAYAAFADCSSLTEVTIPGAVMEISYFAFNNCTSLKAITLPESVESIHESAFENCTGLTKVNIPDRVHTIKEAAFRNCSSLTKVTLPANITEITYVAFADCSSLTEVTIPGSVSEIAYFAFDNCTGLQQVTLPQNVTNVVYDAFSDCTGLTTVVAPVNLNSISDGAFRGCDNLTTVILPENLQTVGTKAFAPFYNVRTMHFTGDAPAFASDAFLGVAATAQYPLAKSTWTASVRQNYGGEILWQSYGDPPADRLPIEEGEVLEQPTVWVDGVEYPIQTDGDSSYIDLPDNASNMVVYGHHEGDPTDVHTQYPTSMQVWVLHKKENGSYRMEHIEEMDDILQYSGMSIRVTGKKGIRMITSVDTNKKTSLTGTGLADYKLLEYGTVVAWARNLTDGKSLTLGQPHTISNYAYKKGVADPVFSYAGNLMQYTNVLVGFSADQMKDDLAMRPYMVVESPEGEKMTIYGGIVYRNIGYIAWQNRNVFEPGSESYDYVWDIIHHVYGEQYDEEYKG